MAQPGRKSLHAAILTGLAASFIALLSSVWAVTGTTPVSVYHRFGNLSLLTARALVAGVPLDYFYLLGFLTLGLQRIQAIRHRQPSGSIGSASTFAVAASVCGLSGESCFVGRFRCLTADAIFVASLIVLVMFALDHSPWSGSGARPSSRASFGLGTKRIFFLIGALSLAVTAGGVLRSTCRNMTRQQAATTNFMRWYRSAPPTTDSRLRRHGAVLVAIFADYRCRASALQLRLLTERLRTFPVDRRALIDIVMFDYPLDTACNPRLRRTVNSSACAAAAAVRALRSVSGEEPAARLVEWLYDRGHEFDDRTIEDYLSTLGAIDAYRLDRSRLFDEISHDVAFGQSLGVYETPAFFVNGVRVPVPLLNTVLSWELSRL